MRGFMSSFGMGGMSKFIRAQISVDWVKGNRVEVFDGGQGSRIILGW